MKPQPIETAPPGDGWILGLVDRDGAESGQRQPWAILTRCDSGWCDDDGYLRKPREWALLPDPQPEATGWRPATGVIKIVPICGGILSGKWLVAIMIADGINDPACEPDIAATLEEALARASATSALLGLPIVEPTPPRGPRLAYSDVPITEGPVA